MTVKLQLLALVNNEFLSFSFFCRFPNSNDSDDVLESHRPLRSLRNTSGRIVNTSSLSTYLACQQLRSVNISGLSTPPDWTVITSGLICQHLRPVNTSRLDCQPSIPMARAILLQTIWRCFPLDHKQTNERDSSLSTYVHFCFCTVMREKRAHFHLST